MWRAIIRLLLLLPLVVAAAGFLWLRSSLPRNDGRLALAGLSGEVRIARDGHGIPTITAANERDAAFAVGVVHAQDRLFQMDAMRRLGAGRLAEWFGARLLGTDRFMRTIGLYRAAERQYGLLTPELRQVLEAYAAGVNGVIAQRRTALPPEYYLINAEPEPWRAADTLVWGKLMALQLAGNFRQELLHARLAQRLKPEELAVLYPPYPAGTVAARGAAPWLQAMPLGAIYAQLPSIVGPAFASNNWVVDGAHSDSGMPVLANDPHLGLTAPSVWYLARIETPTLRLAGVTAAGSPFLVIGHNQRIAWGFTNTESDVEDLFVERLDPQDGTRYLTPDGARAFVTREERIEVRNAPPVTLRVAESRHGPVISELGTAFGQAAATGTVLALQATFLDDDDRSPQAFWAMNHAGNWDEFRAAFRDFVAPEQNIVYADVEGNIGFFAPARVPIRGKGDGWLPAPGWTGEYDWTGYVPFDALPSAYNPPGGRIVTANNKIVPDSYPYFLGRGWDLPNRATRIDQLLDDEPRQSLAASAAIQADTLSLMARDLLPLLAQTPPASAPARAAVDRLKAWDGRMIRDDVAPLLFAAWLRELNRSLLADRLGPLFDDYWGMHPDVIRSILTQHQDWCAGAGGADCGARLAEALEHALAGLRDRYGRDMDSWRWGVPHEAKFSNQFWSNVPLLGALAATAIAANGGYDTIDRGATSLASVSEPFADVLGPSLRMVVDLAAIDAARFMISPGQSGNVLSPHYRDLLVLWRDHRYVTFDDAPVGGTLTLVPQ